MIKSLIFSVLFLSTSAFASSDDPVITHTSDPYQAVVINENLDVVPKCEYTQLDVGSREPVLEKMVCCKNAAKYSLLPLLEQAVSGAILNVKPMDSLTADIYANGCTTNLETTNITLKLKVTYLP